MKKKICKILFVPLVILNFYCCSTTPQYKELNDFSQTQIVEFDSKKKNVYFRVITFDAEIEGKVLVSLKDNSDSIMTLSGRESREYSNDWYSSKTIIEIRPLMPSKGHLKIGYNTISNF